MFHVVIILLMLLLPSGLSHGAEPITVGVSLGLTGQYSAFAQQQKRGFELWQKDVNGRGGILGRPVKLFVHDDKSDPQIAKSLYRQMIDTEKVDFLFGPYSTRLTAAILPWTEKRRFPVLISGAAGDTLWERGYHYAVGIYTPASDFTAGFFELLVKANLDDIAILETDDPFSQNLAWSAGELAKRYGLRVKFAASLKNGCPTMEDMVRRVRKSGAGVLVLCGHLAESVKMRLALKGLHWYPAAFYAATGPSLPAFHTRLGDEANLVFSTTVWNPKVNFPGSQRFLNEYVATFHERPDYHAAVAYAAGEVLNAAIQSVGGIDPERVRAALFKLDTMTIIGRFGIDRTGRQIRQATFVFQWQNGKTEIVWPETVQTARPKFGVVPKE
ncbi:MAG: amino acid ABC transporter substrate-binding protein [Syntrophobacteraceae bacterium]|nr:amino acid ABC transporter substrate-binding protein [Syntrophobacteraceae bacterium]